MKENPNLSEKKNSSFHSLHKVKTIVFFSRTDGDAMSVLRILGPAEILGLRVLRGIEDGLVHPERISESDLVVFQMVF